MIAKALHFSGGAYTGAVITRITRALVVLLLAAGAGCYDPHIGDGTLRCNGTQCPDGFHCQTDGFCWSRADASGVSNGAAGSVGGVTDRSPDSGIGGDRGGGVGGSGTVIGGSGAGGDGTVPAGGGVGGSGTVAGGGGAGGSGTVAGGGGAGGSGTVAGGGGAGHPPPDPDSGVAGLDSGGNRPDVPVVTGSGGSGPARLVNGAHCDRDDVCESGHCVDLVCCEGPCSGKCQACDVSRFVGKCSQVVGEQPHGSRGACGGSVPCAGLCSAAFADRCTFPGMETVCRQAMCQSATFTAAATCNGAGTCSPASPQSCGDFQCNPPGTACLPTCAADTDCARQPYCSQGACRAHRQKGDFCQSAGECEGGHCVDGVCCDSACQGRCQNCALDGARGTCSLVTSGAPRNRPACDGQTPCAGYCSGAASGECTYPQSVSCPCGGLLGLGACDGQGNCRTLGLPGGVGQICI